MSTKGEAKRLSFKLTDDQLRELRPMIEATGRVKIAGDVEGDEFTVSFVACNAAFVACNAPFTIGRSGK